MPSLSITQEHIARAAGSHNGVVGEESGDVCERARQSVCSGRGRVGGDSVEWRWGVTQGKLEEAILVGGTLISVGD